MKYCPTRMRRHGWLLCMTRKFGYWPIRTVWCVDIIQTAGQSRWPYLEHRLCQFSHTVGERQLPSLGRNCTWHYYSTGKTLGMSFNSFLGSWLSKFDMVENNWRKPASSMYIVVALTSASDTSISRWSVLLFCCLAGLCHWPHWSVFVAWMVCVLQEVTASWSCLGGFAWSELGKEIWCCTVILHVVQCTLLLL